MPTYEYKCEKCGWEFEQRQSIKADPIRECPRCQGRVGRLVSGGAGFIMKGSGHEAAEKNAAACSLKQTGKTCCGRNERCGKPDCGDE